MFIIEENLLQNIKRPIPITRRMNKTTPPNVFTLIELLWIKTSNCSFICLLTCSCMNSWSKNLN